ncbi:2,3-bisphosphoglycerate-independent phosphoglycerate mutase [Aliiruegeria sabulilitoris]|uniref:2,3-bisphosphoglycerate-independent phosphoglycerate mutase n=1 Tax=Aliiruegeria sabulilitoris TaxID=1510458 RepID=UPI00082CEDE6|nr:2,3-bisphosphoglycerate-independent phosphoglycerate mutase [Aliiruegeria sabulilitoris]NDR57803.1 2,3-bisphosphoglycerate-independent phosphoglycerate mutase [Pseudoruegeria sp. M32A2M]
MSIPKPVVLCILDGWGIGTKPPEEEGNSPVLANTPTFDKMMSSCPTATLITFGNDVGLPTGQMGNSEVGHTNIGAGRVVAMDLGQIDLSIEDGSFAKKEALQGFIAKLKQTGGTAHLSGLVSPGGVHSHQDHIVEAARVIAEAGVPVQIIALTDGRDVAPKSGAGQVAKFEADLPEGAKVGGVVGRYWAMDRDNRWERVQKGFDLFVSGKAEFEAETGAAACEAAYERGETDEFIGATKIAGYVQPKDGDGLLFLNFRADRAREILAALADPDFAEFDASARPAWGAICGIVEYSDRHNEYMDVIFPSQEILNTLGEWVSKQGKTQFRLAETEKYPHVTFFLNGGVETPYEGEDRFMPKSPKVATYDLQPEMSAPEVTAKFVEAIEKGYDLIVTNYANPDMVGHTGSLEAAKAACEAVDTGLAAVTEALEKVGGAMIVIADHGNCETMFAEDGGPHTAHTTNLVPVILFNGPEGAKLHDGRLADVAPSILELMGLAQPAEMTGVSLIDK